MAFPFLLGGTFIEAERYGAFWGFVEGFPFLLGGTFIEAPRVFDVRTGVAAAFPFLLGGTFIEASPER